MKIAVLSDIHDHIWNLEKVLKQIKGKAEAIIFCGDLCSGIIIKYYLSSLNIPIHACLGNNDEDQISYIKFSTNKFNWIPLSKEYGDINLGNRKIAFCHYPKFAELLAKSKEFDAVFFGHTHVAQNKKIGKTLLLNPGAVCGIQSGKQGKASHAIYDTKTNSAEIVEIK